MHHSGNSPVAEAVRSAAENQKIFEPWYDRCQLKNPSGCRIAPGLEGLFVAEIASRLHQEILEREPSWSFNQCIYMPATAIERKCGFDLSVGHFEYRNRTRLMHKLIRKWCDEPWKWDSNMEIISKTNVRPCANHIANLVQQFRKSEHRIRPYLSFSVCFCLHEHRRMGRPGIPTFEDDQRSLFVDLSGLEAVIFDDFDSKAPLGRVEVVHTLEHGVPFFCARWIQDDLHEMPLPVFHWKGFLDATVDSLAHE